MVFTCSKMKKRNEKSPTREKNPTSELNSPGLHSAPGSFRQAGDTPLCLFPTASTQA